MQQVSLQHTGLEPHATAAKPFDLEVDAHSELRYGRRQQTAGVDVTQEAWCNHTQTDLIPSPPPMEGLGKAGRLPSAAAGVNTTAAVLGLPEYQRITIHPVLGGLVGNPLVVSQALKARVAELLVPLDNLRYLHYTGTLKNSLQIRERLISSCVCASTTHLQAMHPPAVFLDAAIAHDKIILHAAALCYRPPPQSSPDDLSRALAILALPPHLGGRGILLAKWMSSRMVWRSKARRFSGLVPALADVPHIGLLSSSSSLSWRLT